MRKLLGAVLAILSGDRVEHCPTLQCLINTVGSSTCSLDGSTANLNGTILNRVGQHGLTQQLHYIEGIVGTGLE